MFDSLISRRNAVKTWGAALLGASLSPNPLLARKNPGETRVLFLVGDYWHNPITQEKNWRAVLYPTGWRLMFAQATRFVTPEVLDMTDLLITARYAKTNNLGFTGDEIAEKRLPEVPFLTDEREDAIIRNVERGMGLLAMHCTVWNGERPRFMELLGVEKPYMHTPVQPTTLHKINPDHPITHGVEPDKLGEDEIFRADLKPGEVTPLFNLTGSEAPIDTTGGWCREAGKGRVVTLLPGHTPHPFHSKSFKQIMWNAAHWALKRDIPDHPFEDGRPPEDLT